MNRVTGLNENKSKDAEVVPAGVQIGTGMTPKFVRFTLGLSACPKKAPCGNTRNVETAISDTNSRFMVGSLVCAIIRLARTPNINRKLIVIHEEHGPLGLALLF